MLTGNLKKLNTSGRLSIPKKMADEIGLDPGSKVAMCAYEECDNAIMLKPADQTDNCKVINFVNMDSRRRIYIAKDYLPDDRVEAFFDIYLFNGDLIIEQVNV